MEDRSLKNNLDATNKIDDIRLSLNSPVGSKIVWVLVEGNDDCKIYPKFFKELKTRVEFVNGGKGQLIIALTALMSETKQVIGIQDADFAHLNNERPSLSNLLYTDYHDIEITMLSFDAVRNNLFREYQITNPQIVWKNILEESSYIGYIRWQNDMNHNKINFSEIKFGLLSEITEGKFHFKREDLINELNIRSKNKTQELVSTDIENFIGINYTTETLNLCNGHDTTAILALTIGSKVSYKELCRHLRLSFTSTEFFTTKLYRQIFHWQTRNGYDILNT